MKQRKYFVGYAYNKGFGNAFFDANELTKENYETWIIEVEKELKEMNPTIKEKIIILSIKEIN